MKARIAEIAPGLQVLLASGKVAPVKLVPYYDRVAIIYETMATLKANLIEESIVVGLIVILFLLHLRSSLAVLPTLPLALAMSFGVMYWMGVDSNIMSLAGLAIAIGDVSDMGIIMTENIYRRLTTDSWRTLPASGSTDTGGVRQDKTYFDVVCEASTEVGGAIVTAVVNTVISFIPVFALTGPEGKMFRPLAYTKTFAIAASVTVPEVRDVVGKVGRAESSLDPAPISMIETIVTLIPEDDWRMLSQPRWHSEQAWLNWCRPALRYVWPEERRITKAEILEELNQKAAIPGVLPTWLQPIQTRLVMLQTGFRAMMGVKIYGSDLKEIEQIALQMEQILKKVPGAVDVVADRLVGKPYLEYEIDREAAARYGVSIRDIQDVIEIAIGGERLTTTVEGRERYPIRVRYPRELRERFDDLEHILVPTRPALTFRLRKSPNSRSALARKKSKAKTVCSWVTSRSTPATATKSASSKTPNACCNPNAN